MKIGIFTLPLANNYGGVLQAFALQQVLQQMGHRAVVVQRPRRFPVWMGYWKNRLFQKPTLLPDFHSFLFISHNMTSFVKKNIKQTKQRYLSSDRSLNAHNFDACIVGSDQVWRPQYTPHVEYFFLDFLKSEKCKRIAYAASFGIDEWTFSEAQTSRCRSLLQKFDMVSIREKSGIKLCKKHFDRDAEWVLDPTCLVKPLIYRNLANQSSKEFSGKLVYYFLGKLSEKMQFVDKAASHLKLPAVPVMPRRRYWEELYTKTKLDDFVFPRVETWLKGMRDAEYIITDSFHGCVFAIIFNRPFLVISHTEGGMARFHSLLTTFGLENRLVTDVSEITLDKLKTPIDFSAVNRILDTERLRSLELLITALNHV